MSRITERVSRDLGHIADQATPASSAWDSIRMRIEERADESTTEVIMLDTEDKPVRTRPWLAVAAVAAAVVALAVIVGVVVASGDEDSTSETATEAPAAEQENEVASPSAESEPSVIYPRGGPDDDLAGTRWLVYEYLSDGEITRKLRDSTIILHFGHDGTVSGFGGCNDYQAQYEVTGDITTTEGINPLDGQAIQFSGLTSTDTVCEPTELMTQEAQYFEALLDVGMWRIDFDVELLMRVEDGGPHRLSARPNPEE
jgi:heat shock protein HslJ